MNADGILSFARRQLPELIQKPRRILLDAGAARHRNPAGRVLSLNVDAGSAARNHVDPESFRASAPGHARYLRFDHRTSLYLS